VSKFSTFAGLDAAAVASAAKPTAWQTVRVLVRSNRLRTAGIMATIVLASVAEGLGVLTLLPLLQLVMATEGPSPGYVAAVDAAFVAVGFEKSVGALIAVVCGALIVKAALAYFALRHVGFAAARFMTDLRNALMAALAAARWPFFVRHPLGVLSNAMVSEADRASSTYMAFCRFASSAVTALCLLLACLLVDWSITLAAIALGAVVALAMRRYMRLSHESGARITALLRSMVSRISDGMNSLKSLKAMGQEGRIHDLLRREIKELNHAHQRITTAKGAVTIGQEVAGVIVLAVGAYFAIVVYRVDIAQIAVLAALFQRALGQINLLQANWQSMLNTQSGLWAILGLIREAESERETLPGAEKAALAKAIVFDDVRFSYGDRRVLDGVSFAAEAGRLTVVVGPSGAGKTTLVDLVCRLYEPDSGSISIDGTALQNVDRVAWRASIGYVPQDVPLFHDSIRQNVALGDPAIGDAEVRWALERAGAWSFVSAIPDGMDSPVGERGGKLSGGQRQRIAIARALVRRPKLLVLDEPTASLDEDTERELCCTLVDLARHTTVLAISHRPALAEVADRVVRLEAGRIVEAPPSLRAAGAE
jgi:ATP-binding cassette subfamily C protein